MTFAEHPHHEVRSKHLVYRHGQRSLHEVLYEHAKSRPNQVALVWYGREITFAELADWVNRFAVFLRSIGVRRGHRVALFLHNSPQYFIAHYAIQMIGAIVGPCSPSFKALELAYQVSDMDAELIIASDALYPVVAQARAETKLRRVIVTHYGDLLPSEPAWRCPDELCSERLATPDAMDLFEAIAGVPAGAVFQAEAVGLDDVCLLVYTSGTTGRPKGAMLSYRNALFKTAASAQANGIYDDDKILSVMPLSHIAGMLMGLTIPIYVGCPVVVLYRFDPIGVLEAIERARATWWYSTAPMNAALMNTAGVGEYDLSSLRINVCTSFGVQLTEEIADKWRRFTGGCPVYEAAYGLSETHTADTYMPAEAIKWGTQGKPTYETDIRIVDPGAGADLPVGEQGEIAVRNPGVFRGYWRNAEATRRTLRDGWVYTGDIGRLDEDGYLTFLGRIKEMMKVSGFSVFPEDVETLLLQCPDVAQVAVIAVPDETRGEVVKAFVVLHPKARGVVDAAQLTEWAKLHMASYKVPRQFEFREDLPKSSTGKVLRRLLLESAADRGH
ncbi:MAG: AMP-binding protein [Bacilli bacterium]